MSKLIVFQNNEKIVLADGTTIEIDTGMFNDPLGFIVTEATEQNVRADGAFDVCQCVMPLPSMLNGECTSCHRPRC